jgi:hypothetical protein
MGKSSGSKSKSFVGATANDEEDKYVKSPTSSAGGSPDEQVYEDEEYSDRNGIPHVNVVAEGSEGSPVVFRNLLSELEDGEEEKEEADLPRARPAGRSGLDNLVDLSTALDEVVAIDPPKQPPPPPVRTFTTATPKGSFHPAPRPSFVSVTSMSADPPSTMSVEPPPTPTTRAVNAVPIRYDPTTATVSMAKMIETLVEKHEALKHLKPIRISQGSDVRDPQFAAMQNAGEMFHGIIGVFNTAGYSVRVLDQRAILAAGTMKLALAGQAIYDLFLRHQMQRKIERASMEAKQERPLSEVETKQIAEEYLGKTFGKTKSDLDRIMNESAVKDATIINMEAYLQGLAEKVDLLTAERDAALLAPAKTAPPSVKSVKSKPDETKEGVKETKFSRSRDYFETKSDPVEYKTTDYLADIYDECMPPPSTVNAAGRLRQSAAAELKRFDGRTRDEFRSRSWLSTVRSAFRRDQLTSGEACLHFPDLLADRAKNWYRQLSRDVRKDWKSLQEQFEEEYCGATVAPLNRYFSMTRKSNEEHIDYLYRLNVQAIEAGLKYDTARGSRDHIKHFIQTCDDVDLARQLSLNLPSSVAGLRTSLLDLQLQETHARRDESKLKSGKRDAKDDRSARSGSRQKPVNVHAIKLKSPSYGSDDEFESDRASDDELGGSDDDDGGDVEREQTNDDEAKVSAVDEVRDLLTKIFAATRVREVPGKGKPSNAQPPKQVTWQKSADPCTHCGSHRHRDRDCWRRLTCETCGRNGHPAEHCYQQCRGCGKVHDRGKCHLEEMANNLKSWFKPTEHAGILPPSVEKWLN